MKTQFGEIITGDLGANTMTLEIEGDMQLRAGRYAVVPFYDYARLVNGDATEQEKCALQSISISLPSREDYDNRELPPYYFTKDTSEGLSVLYVKGDEYNTYQYNYSRLIALIEEGRLTT